MSREFSSSSSSIFKDLKDLTVRRLGLSVA